MPDPVQIRTSTLLTAPEVARALTLRTAANGVRYATFGDIKIPSFDPLTDLPRILGAVPALIAPTLADRAFYFVPLALPEARNSDTPRDATLISPTLTSELSDEAICHRNVALPATPTTPAHEGVFISTGVLQDQFALAFEFFINAAHAFAAAAGIPQSFSDLAWSQALANTRGETSQDAFEARTEALANKEAPDEKARLEFIDAAFADSLAIYQLSLAVDFDYSELREREYPLLAPAALAERLRLIASLFPPNPTYDFSIRYRRRA